MREESGPLDKALEATIELNKNSAEIVHRYQSENDRLEWWILILSVSTSGSLWVLVSKSFEPVAVWIGAVLSTVTALITLYQKSNLGPRHNLEEALKQQKEATALLIKLQTSPIYDEK